MINNFKKKKNSLGLASSVKMVGLFSVAYIGLATLNNLWNIIGDTRNSMVYY